VITGVILFLSNLKARPVRYAVNKTAGGRTFGSATMPYTGALLLAFIIFHLINFHFVDKTNTTIFNIVSEAFSNTGYVVIYIVAMVIAAIHVSHGFWSAFQTVGANHPKYMPLIRTAGTPLPWWWASDSAFCRYIFSCWPDGPTVTTPAFGHIIQTQRGCPPPTCPERKYHGT
jgi:succinate dehydrogenase hydrophobic anchor subunit